VQASSLRLSRRTFCPPPTPTFSDSLRPISESGTSNGKTLVVTSRWSERHYPLDQLIDQTRRSCWDGASQTNRRSRSGTRPPCLQVTSLSEQPRSSSRWHRFIQGDGTHWTPSTIVLLVVGPVYHRPGGAVLGAWWRRLVRPLVLLSVRSLPSFRGVPGRRSPPPAPNATGTCSRTDNSLILQDLV